MAKGKHSAALFEVIKSAKSPGTAAQSLRTPKWWFKNRPSRPAVPAPEPVIASAPPVSATPAPAVPPVSRNDASSVSGAHLAFDGRRKEFTLRLRYTTALLSGFGVCVLVGLGYVVGRHLGHGTATASAGEVPGLRHATVQPARPGVLQVVRQPRNTAPRVEVERPAGAQQVASANISKPQEAPGVSHAPAGAENDLPRKNGLNYVIVLTYPPEEIQAAEAARDFLTANGVPCTLERTDYVRNPHWVCLVGTAGFSRISSPEFKQYVEKIVRLGEKFPSSHFDRFKPAAYKWKG